MRDDARDNGTVAIDGYDLGATITSPQADLNLGIHLYIDGTPTDGAPLDTSVGGAHSMDYVVTGHSGLTLTTTRTVIVSAAANDPEAPPPRKWEREWKRHQSQQTITRNHRERSSRRMTAPPPPAELPATGTE